MPLRLSVSCVRWGHEAGSGNTVRVKWVSRQIGVGTMGPRTTLFVASRRVWQSVAYHLQLRAVVLEKLALLLLQIALVDDEADDEQDKEHNHTTGHAANQAARDTDFWWHAHTEKRPPEAADARKSRLGRVTRTMPNSNVRPGGSVATMVVDAATVRKENSIRLFSLPLPSTLATWKVYSVPAVRSVALYDRAGAEWGETESGAVSVRRAH